MADEIFYSRHARHRMVLRGISRGEVEAALRAGAKSRHGERIVARYRYFEVVYVQKGERVFVITVKPRW